MAHPACIARSRVVSYVDRYDDKSPKEALGMFRSRIRRVYRHAVVFTWSDLTLDRSRKLVGLQSPVTCVARVDCDSKPNLENYDLSSLNPRTLDMVLKPVCGERIGKSMPGISFSDEMDPAGEQKMTLENANYMFR